MSCETHCCVLTRGEFLISDWNSSNCNGGIPDILCDTRPKPYRKVGNVSSCNIEIQTEVLGKENKYNPISDTCARVQILGVNLTVTFDCASRENLYRALYSEKKEADSGNHVIDYCIDSLNECDFFIFQKQQALESGLGVYLKDASGNVVKQLVQDTDFRFYKSGIEIINNSIDIEDAVTLRLVYAYNNDGYYSFDFLSQKQGYKSLFFKGTNFASNEGAMFNALFHKVLFAPVENFDLITQDSFLTLTLRGSVEKDNNSWFKITKQEG